MTQEEKSLLLQDLSARLPYGVICQTDDGKGKLISIECSFGESLAYMDFGHSEAEEYDLNDNIVKPYLRPMSSMTEEEEIEYDATFATIKLADGHYDSTMTYKSFDFLNEHHFDYRGLIEKGLAIEVTEENNPYKE